MASNLPNFYSGILDDARRNLVRMPDGTYQRFDMPNSTVEDVYRGMYATPQSTALTSRSVSTVPIDDEGNPIIGRPGFSAPTLSATRVEQSGVRPALTAGSQPARTAQMPANVRPASVDRAFAQIGPTMQPSMFGRSQPLQTAAAPVPRPRPLGSPAWDPFGTQVAKDESRLPSNAGEQEFLAAFYPDAASSPTTALDAIESAAPRASGGPVMPFAPSLAMTAARLPSLAGAAPVSPSTGSALARGTPFPRTPSLTLSRSLSNGAIGNNYTIRKGDTLSGIAQRSGLSQAQIMAMNPQVTNANRIRAGASLMLGTLVPDGQAQGRVTYRRVIPQAPSRSQSRAERFTNLNEFGQII